MVGGSVGAALVSGGLSVAAPTLAALTGSLATLAVAGWIALARPSSGSLRRMLTARSGGALLSVGLGSTVYLAGAGALSPFRGLVLGLSLVPLWAVARRLSPGGP